MATTSYKKRDRGNREGHEFTRAAQVWMMLGL